MLRLLEDYRAPVCLEQLPEFSFFKEVEREASKLFEESVEKIKRESKIETASDIGLSKYEGILGLKKDLSLSNKERILRIRCKQILLDYNDKSHFEWALKLMTSNRMTYTLDTANQYCQVNVALASKKSFEIVDNFLEEILPVGWTHNVEIQFKRFEYFAGHKFSEYSDKTFENLRNNEV